MESIKDLKDQIEFFKIIRRKINIIAVPAGTVRRAPQGTTDQQVLPANEGK